MYFVVSNKIDQNLPKEEYEKTVYQSELVKSEFVKITLSKSFFSLTKFQSKTNSQIYPANSI
jgi:hypothetical protein